MLFVLVNRGGCLTYRRDLPLTESRLFWFFALGVDQVWNLGQLEAETTFPRKTHLVFEFSLCLS
eukprot:COSAG06_NODE_42423_length_381_cov_18.978723_2_plen_63_part_01